ncbi:hypothetical protein DJ87_5683 [Bacillus cereus]|nr:hypothetical protein DJ87_5683 [Bacillus cereus]
MLGSHFDHERNSYRQFASLVEHLPVLMNQLLLTTQILLCISQEWEAFVSLVVPYHLCVFHTLLSVRLTFCYTRNVHNRRFYA